MNFHTRLVKYEGSPDDPFRPVATPIYQTATFEQESAVEFGRYDYSRSGNPTRAVLESQLAALDSGTRAFAFASGLAALTAVLRLVRTGDEIVAGDDLYGGAYRLLGKILPRTGIDVKYVDATDAKAVAGAITPRTRLVHVETPTNPMQRIVDVAEIARVAHGRGVLVSVDSSAMSPYLMRPLELGADLVIHSATKYLCGHSDVTAGAVIVRDKALADELYLIQNGEGAGLSPFDSFLLLRGLKTLGLRLDRQQASAQKIAEFLASHAAIKAVHFAGLPGHPGRDVHERQASGAGGVMSFQVGTAERARRLVESLRLFQIVVSFGSISSSISLPAKMSHASIPPALRERIAPPADLVRLSVGIEDPRDLIEDLRQGLAAIEQDSTAGSVHVAPAGGMGVGGARASA